MNKLSCFISNQLQTSDKHQIASKLFIKCLAIIYFSAFLSIAVQISGLVGPNGIFPFEELLDKAFNRHGYLAFIYLPTIFWVDASDITLQAVAYSGCIVSVVLFLGYKPRLLLIVLFLFYLSIYHAGQTFLSFQWDTLLLEAGFLAIFLVSGASYLVIFLYHWLLFRLRFMSGVSKLASDDPSWASLTTLNYYFETQPLPHMGAWYFHQLPQWTLEVGVVLIFISELLVPFFIFLSRKLRITAAAITIFVQLLIIATSNHNWINLLTIALCLFLLDDDLLKKLLPAKFLPEAISTDKKTKSSYILPAIAIIIVLTSISVFFEMLSQKRPPYLISQITTIVRSWGVGHIFHVFPTMQTQRQELQIEGSYDGREWKAYKFKYKPGPIAERPKFIIPHQPRLDWIIWFVPPQHPEFMSVLSRFIEKLKQGSPQVISLLEENPFKHAPPQFIRVQAFEYKFTNFEERKQTGDWWKYRYLGVFPYVRPRNP